MTLLFTSDLHGKKEHFHKLFETAIVREAEGVIIGGDLLPKHGPFWSSLRDQRVFVERFLSPALTQFKKMASEIEVYVMMGNDDWAANMDLLEQLEQEGILGLLHQRVHLLRDGTSLVGYGCVPITPFSVKDWERLDSPDHDPEASGVLTCISTEQGIELIEPEVLWGWPSVQEDLNVLVKRSDPARTIYAMHAPPFGTYLDRLWDGRPVGSRAIRRFIECHQPILTLHGHIHESPAVSGQWWDCIGDTWTFSAGQDPNVLHAILLDTQNIEDTAEHAVYGPLRRG